MNKNIISKKNVKRLVEQALAMLRSSSFTSSRGLTIEMFGKYSAYLEAHEVDKNMKKATSIWYYPDKKKVFYGEPANTENKKCLFEGLTVEDLITRHKNSAKIYLASIEKTAVYVYKATGVTLSRWQDDPLENSYITKSEIEENVSEMYYKLVVDAGLSVNTEPHEDETEYFLNEGRGHADYLVKKFTKLCYNKWENLVHMGEPEVYSGFKTIFPGISIDKITAGSGEDIHLIPQSATTNGLYQIYSKILENIDN